MPLSEKFDHALVYASQLHRDQIRKGSGVPYVAQLLSVSTRHHLLDALLHEALEPKPRELEAVE